MELVPDAGQLSQLMVQATAPAFVLGAVAAFISVLLGRMTNVLDRIRNLNEIGDDTLRVHLKSDIPRLRVQRIWHFLVAYARHYFWSWDLRHHSSGCGMNTVPACCSLWQSACWEVRSSGSPRK